MRKFGSREKNGPYCVGLRVQDGWVPIAWCEERLSKKNLKRVLRKFRNDSDLLDFFQMNWCRFYSDKQEMKVNLPKLERN